MQAFRYERTAEARQMADQLLGLGVFNDRSGLFLAAPRRTGKSTFLRQDLVPHLKERGVLPVYIDLWADRTADPGALIAEGIGAEIRALDNAAVRLARSVGLKSLGGEYANLDITQIGKPDGTTLTEAIRLLMKRSGRPITIIIDEAQHALVSEGGLNAMFALKAARDSINQDPPKLPDQYADLLPLSMVFTGSYRDKLGHLVLKRDQPFFGARITDFPLLDRRYTDAYTQFLNGRLSDQNQFDPNDVFEAFTMLGHRPEKLEEALKNFVVGTGAEGLKATLQHHAETLREGLWADYDREFDGLTPPQQAVLAELIRTGDEFSPFGADALARYEEFAGREIPVATAQGALDALREKNLVWRSARGTYALEDQDMKHWFEAKFPEQASRLKM